MKYQLKMRYPKVRKTFKYHKPNKMLYSEKICT